MKFRLRSLFLVVLSASLAGGAWLSLAQSPNAESRPARARRRVGFDEPADSKHRIPAAAARARAEQLHTVLESTLHVMHRHYFHRDRDRATVPARAMQEVFAEIGRESHIDVRWISVNTKAMSIDNEPEDAFEKQAARTLATGKSSSFELAENGMYRRAGSIPLGGGCLSCHSATSFSPPPTSPRYAALVISVPTTAE